MFMKTVEWIKHIPRSLSRTYLSVSVSVSVSVSICLSVPDFFFSGGQEALGHAAGVSPGNGGESPKLLPTGAN